MYSNTTKSPSGHLAVLSILRWSGKASPVHKQLTNGNLNQNRPKQIKDATHRGLASDTTQEGATLLTSSNACDTQALLPSLQPASGKASLLACKMQVYTDFWRPKWKPARRDMQMPKVLSKSYNRILLQYWAMLHLLHKCVAPSLAPGPCNTQEVEKDHVSGTCRSMCNNLTVGLLHNFSMLACVRICFHDLELWWSIVHMYVQIDMHHYASIFLVIYSYTSLSIFVATGAASSECWTHPFQRKWYSPKASWQNHSRKNIPQMSPRILQTELWHIASWWMPLFYSHILLQTWRAVCPVSTLSTLDRRVGIHTMPTKVFSPTGLWILLHEVIVESRKSFHGSLHFVQSRQEGGTKVKCPFNLPEARPRNNYQASVY